MGDAEDVPRFMVVTSSKLTLVDIGFLAKLSMKSGFEILTSWKAFLNI